MNEIFLGLVYVLVIWWFSTALILFLDSLPSYTFRWSFLGLSALALLSFYAIWNSRNEATVPAAYWAFTHGLILWGWLEASYLMGILTGPWRRPCPEGVKGLARFVLAIKTSLHHELAVIVVGLGLIAVCWNSVNQVAALTFLVLWMMRWSSKLNIYFGVPNLNDEFFPEQLHYLKSFINRRPMNMLFPLSITVATAVSFWTLNAAIAAPDASYEAAAYALLSALLILGTLEHWFLVLPFEDAALWRWAMKFRRVESSKEKRFENQFNTSTPVTVKR